MLIILFTLSGWKERVWWLRIELAFKYDIFYGNDSDVFEFASLSRAQHRPRLAQQLIPEYNLFLQPIYLSILYLLFYL